MSAVRQMEKLIHQDLGGRGLGPMWEYLASTNSNQLYMLNDAAEELISANRVIIATGFYILSTGTGETDGPPGAVSIARAIRALGKTATIVSDEPHRIPLQALIDKENARFPELKPIALEMFPITDDLDKVAAITSDIMTRINPDHLISIERPGRAADGQYYNMRGASIAQYTSKLDELFIRAIENGIPTTCIGDGGNEIGMGNLHDQIVKYVPNGSVLATVTKCKYLISAGVSNWGGYSLACCLAAKYKNRHSPDVPVTRIVPNVNDERESLRVLVELGVVDGMLRAPAMSVDGLDFEKIHAPLILQLVELASHQE